MTERKLNQLYWLNKEIKHQKKRLLELQSTSQVKSPIITGLPFVNTKNDITANYAIEIADLEAEIYINIQKYCHELMEIEKYINTIDDSEMRQIIRLKHISGLTWDDIGTELNMDRRTVSRKYHKFLKVAHNAHELYGNIVV